MNVCVQAAAHQCVCRGAVWRGVRLTGAVDTVLSSGRGCEDPF